MIQTAVSFENTGLSVCVFTLLAVKPLPVVKANQAIRLRAVIDHTSPSGQKRVAGDEWQYAGPLTYKPTAEAVRKTVDKVIT